MCIQSPPSLSEDEDERHGVRGHHRVGRVLREGRKVDNLKNGYSSETDQNTHFCKAIWRSKQSILKVFVGEFEVFLKCL